MKSKWIKKADTQWSNVVRQVGLCEMCGLPGIKGKGQGWTNLFAHHLIERGNYDYRHDPSNGMCLCLQCHKWSKDISPHSNKDGFWNWMKINRRGIYRWHIDHTYEHEKERENLIVTVRSPIKNDWGVDTSYEDKYDLLTEMYKELK